MTDAAKPYQTDPIQRAALHEVLWGAMFDHGSRRCTTGDIDLMTETALRWMTTTLAAKQTIITGQAGRLAVLERQFTEAVAEVDLAAEECERAEVRSAHAAGRREGVEEAAQWCGMAARQMCDEDQTEALCKGLYLSCARKIRALLEKEKSDAPSS